MKLDRVAQEALRFLPDAAVMLKRTLADERVPAQTKAEVAGALAYLVSPFDLLTDWIPFLGQADDLAVIAFALRRLTAAAGEDVLREHWRGSDRAFAIFMRVVSAGLRPRGLVAGAVLGGLSPRSRRPGAGKVIDG